LRYQNYCWVDLAVGGAAKRNNLVDVRKIKLPEKPVDCYRTVFRYPEAMREHFSKHGTVAGYQGYVYADWIPIDIDSRDLAEAHETARDALNQLAVRYDVEINELRIFFSGAKGFHILIPAEMLGYEPSPHLPAVFKELVSGLFDDFTIDLSIYDSQRLLRLSNTINSKTGLYKIPLTAAELLNLETVKILDLAKTPREVIFVTEVSKNDSLRELFKKASEKARKPPKPQSLSDVKGKWNAYAVKPCITKLLEGVGEGKRDNAGLRLASHFFKQSLPGDIVLSILEAWNTKNTPPLKPKDLKRIVESAGGRGYDFGCNDDILKEFCNSTCKYRAEKNREPKTRIKSITDAFEAYLDYIRTLRRARITLGFGAIDERMRGLAPGEVCQVIARSAVGKTTLVINILRTLHDTGVKPVLFFTMEMPLAQVYERMVQVALGLTGNIVEAEARKFVENLDNQQYKNNQIFMNYAEQVYNIYNHCWFVEDDGLDLEQLEELTIQAEVQLGERPRLLVIDYMGRMQSGVGTPYEVTSRIAKGLKHLAKKLNVAILSLHQTSRAGGGDGTEPVTIESARDSGAVEEACDFLIGMWRPEKKEAMESESERVVLALLKNRRGIEIRTEIIFHKPTLRMIPQRTGGTER